MLKQTCFLCKIVGALAGIGALNWGLVAILHFNLVEKLTGAGTTATTVIYGLVGLSGLILLASFLITCPACKKS